MHSGAWNVFEATGLISDSKPIQDLTLHLYWNHDEATLCREWAKERELARRTSRNRERERKRVQVQVQVQVNFIMSKTNLALVVVGLKKDLRFKI